MKNTISERVADFLKNYPPFNALDPEQLERLSYEVTIVHKEQNSLVFSRKEAPHEHFYVVHKGAISLSKSSSGQIMDICDEGDVFGLRPLMAHENYKMDARAHEESILYAVPIALFKPIALENHRVGDFLIESFASNTRNPYSPRHRGKLYGQTEPRNSLGESRDMGLHPVDYSKELVSCPETTPISELASTMSQKRVGCILITREGLSVGIVTDRDLRDKVATGQVPITATDRKSVV